MNSVKENFECNVVFFKSDKKVTMWVYNKLIIDIFSFLSELPLQRCRGVCKHWNQLITVYTEKKKNENNKLIRFQILERDLPSDVFGYSTLASELLRGVFRFLTLERDLQRCGQVCKQWNQLVLVLNKESEVFCEEYKIFGKDDWLKHGFHIGNVPRLPNEIIEECMQKSPIFKDKRITETTSSFLCPIKIDGKPIIDKITEILKRFQSWKHKPNFSFEDFVLKFPEGNSEPCFVRITNHFIPRSGCPVGEFPYTRLISRTQIDYKIPNLVEIYLSFIVNPPQNDSELFGKQLISINNKGIIEVFFKLKKAKSKLLGYMKLSKEESDKKLITNPLDFVTLNDVRHRIRVVERFYG